jgi:O-antigen ligase
VELLAACVAVKLYRQTPWKMVAVIVPIVIFCLLCGSRQILLTMIVLGLVMTLWELPKASRKRYGIVVGVAGLVLAGSVLCLHPRMRDFHPQTSMEMQDNAQDNFARLKIWKAALMTPGDYVAYGLGAGQSTPYLEARYQELGLDSYAQAHYHAHNQYLEVLMELGIGGLLLFLLAWLSVPFCAGEYSRKPAIVFTLLFLLNMCTERMFGMYDGIALWAVGLLFFIAIDQSAPSRAA